MSRRMTERGHTPSRVLVVDDSPLVRKMLTEMLNADPRLEVVGAAGDAYSARREIKALKPDVLTLDDLHLANLMV